MKSKLLAALLASVIAGPALAGSMAEPIMENEVLAPAPFEAVPNPMPVMELDNDTWAGFYAGVNVSAVSQDDPDASGTDFGFHVGYLHEMGDIVVGGEVAVNPFGYELDDDAGDAETAITAKARVGYNAGDFLPYATLGMKNQKISAAGDDYSDTAMTYGVGVDYRMTDNIVIGGELTKAKFDDFDDTGADLDQTTFGAKISYRF